jgi:hypothetical protein
MHLAPRCIAIFVWAKPMPFLWFSLQKLCVCYPFPLFQPSIHHAFPILFGGSSDRGGFAKSVRWQHADATSKAVCKRFIIVFKGCNLHDCLKVNGRFLAENRKCPFPSFSSLFLAFPAFSQLFLPFPSFSAWQKRGFSPLGEPPKGRWEIWFRARGPS